MFRIPLINRLLVLICLISYLYGCTGRKTISAQALPSGQEPDQTQSHTIETAMPYSTDTQVIAKGEALFENKCSACHNFLQKGIGPDLGAVTSQVPASWIMKFIRNAPAMIQAGDSRAVELFGVYNQYMPPFTDLSDSDLQAIVSYIHANRQEATNNQASGQAAGLANPIPDAIVKSGLQLSLQEVATAPATADKVPLARINKMLVLPGKKDRQFIADLRGILYEWQNGQLQVYMDMNKERPGFIHTPGLATGLGSYAFHPQFYKNGLFYTTHTEKPRSAQADFAIADSIKTSLQWVLTEWKVTNPKSAVFSGKPRELWRIDMVSGIHGVQEITFNPYAGPGSADYGLLYIGIGDGGASEKGYYWLCNSNSRMWSSVIRIDPLGRNSRNGKYGIPANNPFVKEQIPDALPELFCRGFRNPNRISWTPSGQMLITDIGHANAEEINLGIAGADYGWPEREGTFVINHRAKMDKVYALPEVDQPYSYPAAQYDHDEGKAISGGFVYTSKDFALLTGKYIFGDIVNGRVFYIDSSLTPGEQTPILEMEVVVAGKVTSFRELSGSKKTDLRFGFGLNNELYLFTKADGKIYKVDGCQVK